MKGLGVPPIAGDGSRNLGKILSRPLNQSGIMVIARDSFARLLPWRLPLLGYLLQRDFFHRNNGFENLKKPGTTMRPSGMVVSFASPGSIKLAKACGIENSAIDLNGIGIELFRQSVEHALDQCAILGRQFNPVKKMKAIPGVRQERIGPAGIVSKIVANI